MTYAVGKPVDGIILASPLITYVSMVLEVVSAQYYSEFLWKYTFYVLACIYLATLNFGMNVPMKEDVVPKEIRKKYPVDKWESTIEILGSIGYAITGVLGFLLLIYGILLCCAYQRE